MRNFIVFIIFLLFICQISFAQNFNQVTTGIIVNDGGSGAGVSWIDYNGDGFLDLYVANVQQENNFLYRNNGDSTFNKVSTDVIVQDQIYTRGASWADFNNDNLVDMYLATGDEQPPNKLYKNTILGSFEEILMGDIVNLRDNTYAGTWGDYDGDSYLDLFVASSEGSSNYLYMNNGDESFTTVDTGVIVIDGSISISGSTVDYDNDGDLDIFVARGGANQNVQNYLFANDGHGNFTKVTDGILVNDFSYSRGASWGDYNNDGLLDVYITNSNNNNNLLYRNVGSENFVKIFTGDIVSNGGNTNGSCWADFNNDGYLDLYVANAFYQDNFYYENNGDGTFTRIFNITTDDASHSGSVACADYDNNGTIDIYVATSDGSNNLLYKNAGNGNNWVSLRCTGRTSNTSAIGAKVTLFSDITGGPVMQYREISGNSGLAGQSGFPLHFGVGDAAVVDSIIINWPSGLIDFYTNLDVNQNYTITEDEDISSGEAIQVSIATNFAFPGDTILVPVSITIPSPVTINSFEMTISDYLDLIELTSINLDSSLLEGTDWIVQSNGTDSALYVAAAGSETISNDGILFNLKFYISDTVQTSFIPVSLDSALFNTGDNPTEISSGGIQIVLPLAGDIDINGNVQAYDASLALQYLVGLIDLEPVQLQNADVTLDSTVSSLDAVIILQYVVNLIDRLPFITGGAEFEAEGTFVMDDISTNPGQLVQVPVYLQDGANIFSFTNQLVYNTDILEYQDVIWPDELNSFSVASNQAAGSLKLSGASTAAQEIDGLICTLQFFVEDISSDDTALIEMATARLNEGPVRENEARSNVVVVTGLENLQDQVPVEYALSANYPNPFNPQTTIRFSLAEKDFASLRVYNLLGEEMLVLHEGVLPAGTHIVRLDGRHLASGVYFYRLETQEFSATRKMILLK